MVKQTKLRKIIDEKGITPYRLAKDCHIAPTDVYNILKGMRPAFPRWRKSISEYLGIPEEEIFMEEGEDNV